MALQRNPSTMPGHGDYEAFPVTSPADPRAPEPEDIPWECMTRDERYQSLRDLDPTEVIGIALDFADDVDMWERRAKDLGWNP